MPLLCFETGVHEDNHSYDGLDVVRDSGAGNDPPANDAENSDAESGKSFVFFRRYDVGEVILA